MLPPRFHLVGGAREGASHLNVVGGILLLAEVGVGPGAVLLLANPLSKFSIKFLACLILPPLGSHRSCLCTRYLLANRPCRLANLFGLLLLLGGGVVGEVGVGVGVLPLVPIHVLVRLRLGRIFES